MPVGHADAADDRADDSHKPLIGSAQKNVGQVSGAVELFIRRAVDGTVVVPREPANRFGSEDVGIDDIGSKVGHETNRRGNSFVVLNHFFCFVLFLRQR